MKRKIHLSISRVIGSHDHHDDGCCMKASWVRKKNERERAEFESQERREKMTGSLGSDGRSRKEGARQDLSAELERGCVRRAGAAGAGRRAGRPWQVAGDVGLPTCRAGRTPISLMCQRGLSLPMTHR